MEKKRKITGLPAYRNFSPWPAAMCVLAGLLLYVILSASNGKNGSSIAALERAPHGEGELQYEIKVKGLTDSACGLTVTVPVRERQYTDSEAGAVFDEILPELAEQILGDNESLEEVRTNLELKRTLEPYGFSVQWESEEPEIIDSYGTVHNEGISENGRRFFLKATVTDGIHEREYEIRAVVYPPLLSEEEAAVKKWLRTVTELDERQQTADRLELPTSLEGRALQYAMAEETDYRMIPLLGIVLAILLTAREKVNQENALKMRERLLLLDYAGIVSKLMVFIGAGMTIRASWELITEEYERAVERGTKERRPAYEEMCHTAARLSSGLSEGKAYNEFGRRCGLQPYVKLAALLEQNRKTGSKNLRQALELEMTSAFEQRKNLARKLGEEAGTKLLLPLFLMLGIVMVMIVVPAFLTFY